MPLNESEYRAGDVIFDALDEANMPFTLSVAMKKRLVNAILSRLEQHGWQVMRLQVYPRTVWTPLTRIAATEHEDRIGAQQLQRAADRIEDSGHD